MNYNFQAQRSLTTRALLIAFTLLSNISMSAEETPVVASSLYGIDSASQYTPLFFELVDRHEQTHTIAAHHWRKPSKKLAVLAHGYLDNCGYLKPVNRWFLQQKFDVICVELPGHGNSSGARADIDDMLVYFDVYKSIFPKLFEMDYQAFVFFAHSAGNVGMTEYLLDQNPHQFDHIFMAAPLIRSKHWELSVFAYNAAHEFVSSVPRRTQHKDIPEYQALLKHDPSPIKWSPLNWFASLQRWNTSLENDKRIAKDKITVMFAEDDSVIDTEFNKAFIEKRFPNAEIHVFEGSDHMLHYEEEAIRDNFFKTIENRLKQTVENSN
ncbi:Lysophospholipase, alpha-beta hydrolase superfamily [Alteromonadaceae bacterium Bs31]|nr:Lysophospholipase, alpha-beta hydrolase superfamily [Alteromonadaceae bacterium Bs31]